MAKAGRVVQVVGIVLTAYDLEQATEKSIKTGSVKPISAEVIRQAGGWGGFVAGAKIGTLAGAAVGGGNRTRCSHHWTCWWDNIRCGWILWGRLGCGLH